MSKKIIAVAAAAALALTGLVGIAPAMANTQTAVLDGGTGAGTEASPEVVSVPDTNTLASKSATLTFSNLATGDVIRATTSGAVKLTTAATAGSADLNVTTLGTQNYSQTATSASNVVLYAYTTNLTATKIQWSITRTGSAISGEAWIQGSVGQAHYMTNVNVPATLADTKTAVVSYNLTDVFGNAIETGTMTGAIAGASAAVNAVWDATDKRFEGTITSNKDTAFVITIDGNGTGTTAPSVAGFAKNTLENITVVNGTGVATQVAALTAQVATLTATVAKRVSKKKYNTLARKWNAAFPSQKVALKK